MTSSIVSAKIEKQPEVTEMLSLHTRLEKEADKIRKWKVQTEAELERKVRATAVLPLRELSDLYSNLFVVSLITLI